MQIDDFYIPIIKKIIFNCPVIIFLFDITKEESYRKIQKIIEIISNLDKNSKIRKFVLGNKLDLEENRVISGFEAQSFVNQFPCFVQYMDISFKTRENYPEFLSLLYTSFTSPLSINRTNSTETVIFSNKISDDADCIYYYTLSNVYTWIDIEPPEFKTGTQIYNIILLGGEEVGKSSFLSQLNAHQRNGNGIIKDLFKYVKIRNTEIKLHLWDTAGLEKYQSITPNYYKQADGVIVMFDLTNEDTLNKGEKWFKEAAEYLRRNAICFLVGNKLDLIKERQITQDIGNKIALSYGMKYLEISCTKNINIDELVNAISWDIYANGPDDSSAFSFDSIGLIKGKSKKIKNCC